MRLNTLFQISKFRLRLSMSRIIAILLILAACEKIEQLDLLFTGKVAEPSDTAVQVEGVITDLKNSILQHGHCYALTPLPTISDLRTQLGPRTEVGTYVSNIENLSPNTLYFIRGYLVTDTEVIYGEQISVQTKPQSTVKPFQVTTDGASNLRQTTVSTRGTLLTETSITLKAYGHCWSTQNTVSLDNPLGKSDFGARTPTNNFEFMSDIDGLTPATVYYYRAYAIDNADKRYYGTVKQFRTASN
jgi:hypothetical protein